MKLEIFIPERLARHVRELQSTGLYGEDHEAVAVLLIRDAIRQCVADNVIDLGKTDFKARTGPLGDFGGDDSRDTEISKTDAPQPEETVSQEDIQPFKPQVQAEKQVYRDVAPAEKPVYPKTKIKGARHAVLTVLERAEGKPITMQEIAKQAGIASGSVTWHLSKLEEAGLVKNHGIPGQPNWTSAEFEPQEQAAPVAEPKEPVKSRNGAPLRRFTEPKKLDPANVRGLKEDHPAAIEGRTLFPSTVVDPAKSERILISGINSSKIGSKVVKGPWAGMPIYTLTLEERASCPKSCAQWQACYGNNMQWARQHKHGPELVEGLLNELDDLERKHPEGFVVRLQVLGDFYSTDYVKYWAQFLHLFPALHVFGYTAHPRKSDIGAALKRMTDTKWNRFAIRFSDEESKPQGAAVIDRIAESDVVPEGIVCPAQTGKTACCGTCGLCWSGSAKDKTIVFMKHGGLGRKATVPEDREARQEKERTLRAELGKYLREKEIPFRAKIGGRFEVRGEEMTLDGIVALANDMRADDGLEEFSV